MLYDQLTPSHIVHFIGRFVHGEYFVDLAANFRFRFIKYLKSEDLILTIFLVELFTRITLQSSFTTTTTKIFIDRYFII